MKKKIGVFLVVLFSMIALGTAQSYTLTDADSNLTDTQLTADFSGLPADTQLTLESLGNDQTDLATFTTKSSGSATVSWRHNPFEDGTALISDGWTYRLLDKDGSTNYEFEVKHGNMLTTLDTFNDGVVNNNIVEATEGGNSAELSESNGLLNVEGTNSPFTVTFEWIEFNRDEAVNFNLTNVQSSLTLEGSATERPAIMDVRDSTGDLITTFDIVDGFHQIYYDNDNGDIVVKRDGSVISSSSSQSSDFYVAVTEETDLNGRGFSFDMSGYSHVPRISRKSWKDVNVFNPKTKSLLFNNFLINQNGTSGIEFSNDGSSWSSTLPSSSSSLYYRNTGNGTLGAVATDTSRVFQELTFNPIRPNNNTALVVEENASLNRDFLYEILYERTDCSQFAGLFSSFQLFNQSSGNQLTSTTYPNIEIGEGQCTFFQEFTEEENLPSGDYRWRVAFQDNNLGISESWNQYFSIEESQNVPVSFELRDPDEGETVFLDNGSTEFSYSVDADTQGTLELVIPQYQDSVRYSTTIGSGNQTGSVVLNLDYGVNYDWYLTWTNSTTYQSETNSFNTASEGESPDDGDTGDGDDGTQDGNLIVNIWFSILEYFGITGTVADVFTASVLVMAVTIAATLVTDSVLIGVLVFNLGLTVTTIAGLLPGWMLFLQITLAGVAAAYLYQKVSSS